MDNAKQLWSWWYSLWASFGPVFTRPGWVRFVPWVTGMVIGWEEHTITPIEREGKDESLCCTNVRGQTRFFLPRVLPRTS